MSDIEQRWTRLLEQMPNDRKLVESASLAVATTHDALRISWADWLGLVLKEIRERQAEADKLASEREACAQIAERYAAVEHEIPRAEAARAVAAMIRQRGKS